MALVALILTGAVRENLPTLHPQESAGQPLVLALRPPAALDAGEELTNARTHRLQPTPGADPAAPAAALDVAADPPPVVADAGAGLAAPSSGQPGDVSGLSDVTAAHHYYEALIESYKDWDAGLMIAIMYRSSGGRPTMFNQTGICVDGSAGPQCPNHAQGLLDMARPLHDWAFAGCDGSTPECQILAGHRLWVDSGYAPWYPLPARMNP